MQVSEMKIILLLNKLKNNRRKITVFHLEYMDNIWKKIFFLL